MFDCENTRKLFRLFLVKAEGVEKHFPREY